MDDRGNAGRGRPRRDAGGRNDRAGDRPRRDAGGRNDGAADRPRREPPPAGPRRSAPADPRLPDDVRPEDLDPTVRAELRTLTPTNADTVARYLVQVGRLLDLDPDEAYANAMAAQHRAGRVAVVREVTGVAAYRSGRFAEALAEFRAARRLSGSAHLLPLMADSERGLGRPERALDLAASPEAGRLAAAERVELAIVTSGARRDLGQVDAAVLALQTNDLRNEKASWWPRLAYAYADALEAAGRSDEAHSWLIRAAAADTAGETDAAERLADAQGIGEIVDLDEDPGDERDAEPGPTATGS